MEHNNGDPNVVEPMVARSPLNQIRDWLDENATDDGTVNVEDLEQFLGEIPALAEAPNPETCAHTFGRWMRTVLDSKRKARTCGKCGKVQFKTDGDLT